MFRIDFFCFHSELVHCGKKLLDGDKLADFPTLEQPNATVYVFCKKTTELTQGDTSFFN